MSRRVVAGGVAFVAAGLLATFGPYADVRSRLNPRTPFEEAPASTGVAAAAVLDSIGPAGRSVYLRQLRWDVVLIVCNALWLGIWLRAAMRRTLPGRQSAAIALALVALPAAADLLENGAIWQMIESFPAAAEGWVRVASYATRCKHAAFGLAVLSAAGCSVGLLVGKLRQRARMRRTVRRRTTAQKAGFG